MTNDIRGENKSHSCTSLLRKVNLMLERIFLLSSKVQAVKCHSLGGNSVFISSKFVDILSHN